jgi:AraC family transcriptional regulator
MAMPASPQGAQNPVTPDERLAIASVRPTTSAPLGWIGVRAEHLSAPAHCEVDVPPTTHHWLILNHGRPAEFALEFAGERHEESPPPGSVILIPAGTPSRWRWRGAGESTHILVEPQLPARVAAEALDLNPDRVALPPVYGLPHPDVRAAMLALDAELLAGAPGGRLLAESFGNVLAVHLLRHFAGSGLADPHPGGVLPRHKLRAVIEYIHEHLDAELSLDHLAGVAHVSPYHFARLFKNSTGLPPHQYVIARRVERAKELLRQHDDLPLIEVALEAGFANQSHLTRHFKRLVGVTPGRVQSSARRYQATASL